MFYCEYVQNNVNICSYTGVKLSVPYWYKPNFSTITVNPTDRANRQGVQWCHIGLEIMTIYIFYQRYIIIEKHKNLTLKGLFCCSH